MQRYPWLNKISNTTQLGGIETSVLDNGPGRGTRIAWINTGTGLRYKVVLDRAMDITDAFYNHHSLAWISHGGITPPQPFSDRGPGWLKTFGGGLLTTCGLSHVGGPESDEYGERGIHGDISNLVAEVESIVQPDPFRDKLDFSITGRIKQSKVFGPCLELRRTISGVLGEATIRIHDDVVNFSNTPQPHMILYHFNFGWPFVDEGTDLVWKGSWMPKSKDSAVIFKEGNDFKKVPAPMDQHKGTGEEVGFITPDADEKGNCECGLHNSNLGLAVSLQFRKNQLPWLINWQHWGSGEYVTGIEPGTHPPIGQAQARKDKTLIFLEPGATVSYDLQLEVIHTETGIQQFLKQNKS